MPFLYSILLKLLYPTSIALLLLLASAVLRRRARRSPVSSQTCEALAKGNMSADLRPLPSERVARVCLWLAVAVMLICGNGWVVKYSTRCLERQYPPLPLSSAKQVDHSQLSPLNSQLLQPDVILVLGGGQWPKVPPRPTVEVAEAGDRVLYAAYLFKNGRAPKILCTSGMSTGSSATRPASATMAELLENMGVPRSAIIEESLSRNTHEHGRNLYPMLQAQGIKRVLLVTSALHMPRSVAVFKKQCPGIEFIPAPTDFRIVDSPLPWHRQVVNLIPTPSSYLQFSETMHEYLGLAYYRLRGWI